MSKHGLTKTAIILSSMLPIALFVAACQPSALSTGQLVGNVREFRVEGGDFYFKPKDLTATAGERVRILFTNQGKIPHELEISRLGATNVDLIGLPANIPDDELNSLREHAERGTPELWLPPNATATVEFTVTTPGTYKLACEIEGHVDAGMVGTFTVRPVQ